MSRDWALYVADMIDACRQIAEYTHAIERHAFLSDRKTYDATLRNLEVLGEAAKHVPAELRVRHPGIAWRDIAGFRDVLAHAYFGIDEDVLWDVVSTKVPELLAQLEAIPLPPPAGE